MHSSLEFVQSSSTSVFIHSQEYGSYHSIVGRLCAWDPPGFGSHTLLLALRMDTFFFFTPLTFSVHYLENKDTTKSYTYFLAAEIEWNISY